MAEIGSALHDFGRSAGWSHRVDAGANPMKVGREPIQAPFPHIAGDGIESVSIGRKRIYRTGSRIAVFRGVVGGEFTLPDIAKVAAGEC